MTAQPRPGGNSRPALRPVPQLPPEPEPPPHDPEAETAAVGCLLMATSGTLEWAEQYFQPRYCYRALNQKIAAAALALWSAGKPVDMITVAGELRARGQLDECGGPFYLSSLIEACPCEANLPHYLQRVISTWQQRQLMVLGERLFAESRKPDADVCRLLELSMRRLTELKEICDARDDCKGGV